MIGIACGRPSRCGAGADVGRSSGCGERDCAVESRACGHRGDRDDLDVMATVRQGVRQVADMLFLTAGDRGVELGHHQHSHVRRKLVPAERSLVPHPPGFFPVLSAANLSAFTGPECGDRGRGIGDLCPCVEYKIERAVHSWRLRRLRIRSIRRLRAVTASPCSGAERWPSSSKLPARLSAPPGIIASSS